MFVRITLPACRNTSGYCTGENLLKFFQGLGFEIPSPKDESGAISPTIEIERNEGKSSVPRFSEPYYRDQAARNLTDEVSEEVRREIASNGVYLGALSSIRSYLAVTRTSDSEITLFIFHDKLEDVVKGAEEVLRRIQREKGRKTVFDYSTIYESGAIELNTDQAPKLLAKASLSKSVTKKFISDKSVELAALAVTLLLILVCLLINTISVPPPPAPDVISSVLRLFAEKAWPSLAVSACVLSLALIVSYIKMPRKLISWKWN